MIIAPVPRNFIRTANWHQSDQRRQLQRSEWTGRTRETLIGPADRWSCAAEVRPMKPDDLTTWRGFQARMKQPGSAARVQAVEQSQFGLNNNLVRNGDFVGGSAPWLLDGVWSFLELGAPPDLPTMGLYSDASRSAGNAFANGGEAVPIAGGQALQLSCDVFRSLDSAGLLGLVVNFRNAAGVLISTLGVSLMHSAPQLWQRVRGTVIAPAGTVSGMVYLSHGLTAGFAAVTGVRASRWPERAEVAAGSTAMALNLWRLEPNLRHLRAGQLLTVLLPSGDEQLITLTADLVASAAGTATAQLASPLREIPTAGAAVELARPWALMRAIDPMAWSVDVGQIYAARTMQFEEAF